MDYLRKMEINCVLDVGACTGAYAQELRQLGYRGNIISFEPVPTSFQILRRNMEGDPHWQGQNCGLSDATQVTTIQTYSVPEFNSLLRLREDAGNAYHVDSGQPHPVEIQLQRLDEVLPDLVKNIPAPRVYLKIDTQGHDLGVLRGATGVLDKVVGIQSEMSVVPLYDEMPTMSDSLLAFRGCGYVPIGFFPVNTFEDKMISPEFDVVMNRFNETLA
jgi:FkbM family methyltransferase